MVRRQREIARPGGVVMDGRDIGTVVLPDADFKFYLTASLAARAKRRQRDLVALGFVVDLAKLTDEIEHRDYLDSSRAHSPLRRAADAVLIDTTEVAVKDVVAQVIARCRQFVD
jgi:cytidylate kinase